MGADQQFCLRWNNFHTNITSAFESLRDDEDFVDITLACEGRQVKAHKMVLSACSPYFRSLLKGNPCQHPIVFLKDVTFANLASILDFMYHGEVNVSHNELATFLKTAEALKVRGLAEDDKRKDSDGYVDASSPGPPRDPPDPGSPRPDETSATDTHLSESPPPHKKRRRSGTSVQSAEDTNETVISEIKETSVKNEPQEFNDEDDILGHSIDTGDLKADNVGVSTSSVVSGGNEDGEDRSNFSLSDSVTISRSQAAMQQLQESFGSFLPAMSQSSGFLPHGATDMPRPPFPLEGVQGLPPGISTLPGPSMSQAGASQDTSQGGWSGRRQCGACGKLLSSKYALQVHMRDVHSNVRRTFSCSLCGKIYASQNSYRVHMSLKHRNDHANFPVPGQQQQQQRSPQSLTPSPLGQIVLKREAPSPSTHPRHDIQSPSPRSLHEIHSPPQRPMHQQQQQQQHQHQQQQPPPHSQHLQQHHSHIYSSGSQTLHSQPQLTQQHNTITTTPTVERSLHPSQCLIQSLQEEQKELHRNNSQHQTPSPLHSYSSCSQSSQGGPQQISPFSPQILQSPPQPSINLGQHQQQQNMLLDYSTLSGGARIEESAASCLGSGGMVENLPVQYESLPSQRESSS